MMLLETLKKPEPSVDPTVTHGTNLGITLVRIKVRQWNSENVAKGRIETVGVGMSARRVGV
jgi:hypothetical protein